MPFVIDDIAAAAATEAATAEVGSTVGVEATTSTELAAVPESTAVADDVLAENTSSLDMSDNVFVDEYPSQETSEVGVEPDKNVFYDEYPADVNTEADSAKDVSAETTPEIETPKSYNEFCETRNSGGSYKELRNEGWGWNDNPPHEVHHMPADSASNLEREDGPAIAMDYSDHQKTASYGSSRDAKEYRAAQKELIDKGDFRGALQMDIDDIRDKFGDKYNDALTQMQNYIDKLEQAGKI